MKIFFGTIVFVFVFSSVKSQDTIKHFEFGSTLVTANLFKNFSEQSFDRPHFEFVNALFFRYTEKRFGLRANCSYSENYFEWSDPPGTADGSAGTSYNKDFRIGIGAQITPLKKWDFFYTFLDVSYRNIVFDPVKNSLWKSKVKARAIVF